VGYVPKRGDLIWLTFQLQAGHEQNGRRPALVVSPAAYNGKVGLALVCPVTLQVKGYPFEVPIANETSVRGVVLADQLRSLDWQARDAEYIGHVSGDTMSEVAAKIRVLIEDDA
jgi:mRNA interferase MazF